MLVAWRVKEWVEPLLYRTITVEVGDAGMIAALPALTRGYLSSILKSKPSFFFQRSVRHLLLSLWTETPPTKICSLFARVPKICGRGQGKISPNWHC
ncbi:hypothetical protein C8R44DRAFT_820231 [Mycena epipterygia]|nr:hypothetical protein C8R44DRAFT_820231 [Mycena epipterygia]